jgi:hypothetical protein
MTANNRRFLDGWSAFAAIPFSPQVALRPMGRGVGSLAVDRRPLQGQVFKG